MEANTLSIHSLTIDSYKIQITLNKTAPRVISSLIIECENTKMLCTISMQTDISVKKFAPLIINYIERPYGSKDCFSRKNNKSFEKEALISRSIDRIIRPLIPNNSNYVIHIMCLLLQNEEKVPLDFLAVIGCVSALGLININNIDLSSFICISVENKLQTAKNNQLENIITKPDDKVNLTDDKVNLIKTDKALEDNQKVTKDKDDYSHYNFRFLMVFLDGGILMIEGQSVNLPKDDFLKIVEEAQIKGKEDFKKWFAFIESKKNIIETILTEKSDFEYLFFTEEFITLYNNILDGEIDILLLENHKFLYEKIKNVLIKMEKIKVINDSVLQELSHIIKNKYIIESKNRINGRKMDEIREITISQEDNQNTDASIFFKRGNTHIMGNAVLSTEKPNNGDSFNHIKIRQSNKISLLYTSFPFAVNEVTRWQNTSSRREIGHSKLISNSVVSCILENSNQNVKIFCDVFSSDGSSSMASVCCSSLLLFLCKISNKSLAVGISIGLAYFNKKHAILVDLDESEDFLGFSDLKISFMLDTISAIQIDIKKKTIPVDIFIKMFNKGYLASKKIQKTMEIFLKKNKNTSIFIKKTDPTSFKFPVHLKKVGLIIGVSGKTIKNLQTKHNAKISMQENIVYINASSTENAFNAQEEINRISNEQILTDFVLLGYIEEVTNKSITVKCLGRKSVLSGKKAFEEAEIGDYLFVIIKKTDDIGNYKMDYLKI
jgi:polyribonucleotide nucleotidyltransferase